MIYFPGFLYQLAVKCREALCAKGLEALEGLKWDGHELFSFDIVGKLKWVDHVHSV